MTVLVWKVRCDKCKRVIDAKKESFMQKDDVGDLCEKCWRGMR